MTGFWSCPPHVRSADLGRTVVVLDTRTGQVETLLGSARRLWLMLAATPTTAESGPHLPDVDDDQAKLIVQQLHADGLLEEEDAPLPWTVIMAPDTEPSWGTQELDASLAPAYPVPARRLFLATIALAAVLFVRSVGRSTRSFARLTALAEAASRLARQPADQQVARMALLAVRRVACLTPARAACLEQTTAAVLALAMTGDGATWCHGVAADPIRLHAWLALSDGTAIAEPASTSRYTPLLQIPTPPTTRTTVENSGEQKGAR